MKLVRYGSPGRERPGVIGGDGQIRVLSSIVPDLTGQVFESGLIEYLQTIDIDSLPVCSGVNRLGAPVSGVSKIVLCALNYHDHAKEAGLALPEELSFLFKSPTSIIGYKDSIILPEGSESLDWEAELAFVIGKTARHVKIEDADQYITGYTLINDISERDFQLKRGPTWTKGKSCETFAPLGPWLVTRDEILEPDKIDLWLEVNGVRMQSSNTSQLIFSIPEILSTISRYVTLLPGDIVATGTPGGVGYSQSPPIFLKAGDEIFFGATGLSQQNSKVVTAC